MYTFIKLTIVTGTKLKDKREDLVYLPSFFFFHKLFGGKKCVCVSRFESTNIHTLLTMR